MWILLLLLLLTPFQSQEQLPLGITQGSIEDSDPVIHNSLISQKLHETVVRQDRYLLKIEAPGHYTVTMRALLFDAYLIIQDEEGNLIAQDNDGLYDTHARALFEIKDTSKKIYLYACALKDGQGPYELCLQKGKAAPLTSNQRQRALFLEAQKRIQLLEKQPKADLADAVLKLAVMYFRRGEIKEAESSLRRVIGLQDQFLPPDHPDRALVLNNLGSILFEQAKYDEAAALLRRSLNIVEKAGAEDKLDTLVATYNLASILSIQGKPNEAKPLLEKALYKQEQRLGKHHPKLNTILYGLSLALENLGEKDQAEAHLRRALLIAEKHYDPNDLQMVRPLYELSKLLERDLRCEEAIRLLDRALLILKKTFGPDHPNNIKFIFSRAINLYESGRYNDAKETLRNCLAILDKTPGAMLPMKSRSLTLMGELLVKQGSFQEARPLLDQALKIQEKIYQEGHRERLRTLNFISTLYYYQGNFSGAQEILKDLVRKKTKYYGSDHGNTASSMFNLSIVLSTLGDKESALELSDRTFKIYAELIGEEHPKTIEVMFMRASLLAALGRIKEAKSLFKDALNTLERNVSPDHVKTADCLEQYAAFLMEQGEYVEARSYFERSLGVYAKLFGPEHPCCADIKNLLVQLYCDLKDRDQAWSMLIDVLAYEASSFNELLWSLNEKERLKYAALKRRTLNLLMGFADDGKRRTCYENLLQWKGRVFRSLVQSQARLKQSLDPEAATVLKQLERAKARLAKELHLDWSKKSKNTALLKNICKEIDALENQLVRYAGRAEKRFKPSYETLVSKLPRDAAVLDFYVYKPYSPAQWEGDRLIRKGQWNPSRLCVWILNKDKESPVFLDLGETDLIQKAVQGFVRGISKTKNETLIQNNERIASMLWTPMAPHLKGVDKVYISPDSFLGAMPFDAIRVQGKYLLEDFTFVPLQELASLAPSSQGVSKTEDPIPQREILLVGSVDYENRDKPTGEEEGVYGSEISRGGMGQWRWLPGTKKEVEAISSLHKKLFKDSDGALTLTGASATEGRIKRELPRHRLVHIATHGFFQPQWIPSLYEEVQKEERNSQMGLGDFPKPLAGLPPGYLSGLVLAGVNGPASSGDEGLLTAEELSWLDLSSVDLVTLSACETGLGTPTSGEGIIGLGYAFRKAGVRNVITSLWKVDDRAAAVFFPAFYQRIWEDGMTPSQAIRQVKLDMLHNKFQAQGESVDRDIKRVERKAADFRAPYFWASFLCWGE